MDEEWRVWFKVDDTLAFHHKTIKAGNAAMGLWLRAGSWCSQQLTDGFVPTDMAEMMGSQAQIRRLVSAVLWAEVEGGFQFHEWGVEGRQPTRVEVKNRREKERKRKQKFREKLHESSTKPEEKSENFPLFSEDQQVNDGCPTGRDRHGDALPTRPDPTRPIKEQSQTLLPRSAQPKKRACRIPEDFTVTPEMVTWAAEHAPSVDGRFETAQFVDYWTSASGARASKLDWVRTWQTWMRTAQQRCGRTNGFVSATDANIAKFIGSPSKALGSGT